MPIHSLAILRRNRHGGSQVRKLLFPLGSILLAGCATSSIAPIAQDTMRITTEQPFGAHCSPEGVTSQAFQQASEETIKRGYDRFMIVDSEKANDRGGCVQVFVVKMFTNNDPAGAKALSAREQLARR